MICSLPFRVVAASILLAAGTVESLSAQTLLRWKFQPGETLRYAFTQRTESETTGAGKPTSVSVDMSMQLSWQVKQVDANGTATLNQTVDKLAITMKTDKLDPVVYDSALRAPTSGPARDIAEAVAPLIGAQCAVKISSRGEILLVEPSEPLRSAWEKSQAGSLLSAQGLAHVLSQASCVLPEQPVAAGAPWELTQERPTPLGNLDVVSRYELAGNEPAAGKPATAITVTATLHLHPPKDAKGPPVTLKESAQSGKLFFDTEAGRFRASQIEQRLLTERPYRESTIRVRTTTTMDMKLVDAGQP